MTAYPQVMSEIDTLRQVAAGRSIARYGDGEIKMAAHNSAIKSQHADDQLSRRLREILHDSGDCLVGIPNIHSATPKAAFWNKHVGYARLLVDRPYVSAFISRPDSAPWIDTDEYWDLLESLWRGQDVTVVRGSHKSLAPDDIANSAGRITDVVCRTQHAWQDYDQILDRIGTPKRALICLGPTATVLAVDLCARGVHAVDLGHVALFLRKRRRGEPLQVTDDDRAVDRKAVA